MLQNIIAIVIFIVIIGISTYFIIKTLTKEPPAPPPPSPPSPHECDETTPCKTGYTCKDHKCVKSPPKYPEPDVPECVVDDNIKIDCIGITGMDEKTCVNNDECCYDPTPATRSDGTAVPWCYKKLHTDTSGARVAKERYYSYGKTITEGGVMPSYKNTMDSVIGDTLDKSSINKAPTYTVNYFPFNSIKENNQWKSGKEFVDWDSNSGMLCGNTWGKPSNQARVIYNLLSLWSNDSVLFDMDQATRNDFLSHIFYKKSTDKTGKAVYKMCNSSDWQASYYSNGPSCYPHVWMEYMNYVHGFMGLQGQYTLWGNQYCFKNMYDIYWFHAGATYGYGSFSLFVPASISGDFEGSILEGIDIAFVCSNNYDYDDKNTGTAIYYVCWKLTNFPQLFLTKESLKALMKEALYYTFKTTLNISDVGMTPTLGCYYLDQHGNNVNEWVTLTLTYNQQGQLIQTDPGQLYPFKNGYLGSTIEPAYYFGSGTKPITAMLVVNALYRATKSKWTNVGDFRRWYTGPYIDQTQTLGQSIGSVAMKDILSLATSTYYETIGQFQNNPVTNTVQVLLPQYIYNSNACMYRGYAQHLKDCPSRLGKNCSIIPATLFNQIFMNDVTVFDIACMKAGIPDSDTLGLDTPDQNRDRIYSFGPMGYVSELIGFDWIPGYKLMGGQWYPNTPGADNSYYPPSSYTSSGYTLLGSFLWFLDYNVGKKRWWEININASFLPKNLQSMTNFAGTSGNDGTKYMINVGESFNQS